MKHFSILKLPYLSLRRPFFFMFLMAGIALFLGGLFAAAGSAQLAEKGLAPITLGIVSGEQDQTMERMLEQFTSQADVFPNVRFLFLSSQAEARAQVDDGTISAALVLPKQLVSWVNGRGGENPLLIVKKLSSVEHAVFQTIGKSYLRMLTVAQRGVSLALQAYRLEDSPRVSYDVVWLGTNLAYLNLAVDQMTRFNDQIVSGPQSLSYPIHATLCISFGFLLLLTPLLHEALSISKHRQWIRRMGSVGISLRRHSLLQLAASAAGFALLLSLFSAGFLTFSAALHEEISLSPLLPGAIVLAAVFLALFSFFFANLGSPLFGGLLSALMGIIALITSGGLLPNILLPKFLQSLSVLSPVLWLRDIFAACLNRPGIAWGLPALALFLCNLLLFLGILLICRVYERRDL